jgi:dolichol-phosphate mannosyltransferase
MQVDTPSAQITVSVILHGAGDREQVLAAVRTAGKALAGVAQDHEILVVGPHGVNEIARAMQEETNRNPRVRWLPCPGSGEYSEILRLASASARFSLVAVAHAAVDCSNLDYLVPLAQCYPVVCGYRLNRQEPLQHRLCSWCYNTLSRLLLGTRVRDCASGLVVFWKSVLVDLFPEADGQFTDAEVFARARRQGLTVAEVPVRRSPLAALTLGPRWRDLPKTFLSFLSFWWSRTLFPGRAPALPTRGSWFLGCLLMVLAGLVLFPELDQPLVDPDEGRQAEIPREMLSRNDFLTPHMMGYPYYEKPPLQYWLTASAYLVFGTEPWVARFVPAFAAWLTVLLTYLWGRRALGVRPAFLGGLGLCLSLGFIMLGRAVLLDSLLTACVVAAWYAGHSAVAGPTFRWGWWVASALVCGLGILAKGPVALVLFTVPVAAYQYLNASPFKLRWRQWFLYLAVCLAVAAPWYIAMALSEPGYVKAFLWKANFLRFVKAYDHQNPWWYYLPILFVGTLPWSLLWAWLTYFLFSRSRRMVMLRRPGLGFCALTVLWCLAFFSLSGCKSPFYPASALAPLALMHGVCLDAILFRRAGRKDRFLGYARQLLPRRATTVMLLLSMGCYLVTGVLQWETWGIVVLELALTLVVLTAWWRYGRRASPKLAWGVCAAATLAMVVVGSRDLLVGFASRHSIDAIAKVARRSPARPSCCVVSYGRQWPSASFYLEHEIVWFFPKEYRQLLVNLMQTQPEVRVLVERGKLLDELLSALPPNLDVQVSLPDREGQAAFVVVHQRSPNSLAQRK